MLINSQIYGLTKLNILGYSFTWSEYSIVQIQVFEHSFKRFEIQFWIFRYIHSIIKYWDTHSIFGYSNTQFIILNIQMFKYSINSYCSNTQNREYYNSNTTWDLGTQLRSKCSNIRSFKRFEIQFRFEYFYSIIRAPNIEILVQIFGYSNTLSIQFRFKYSNVQILDKLLIFEYTNREYHNLNTI